MTCTHIDQHAHLGCGWGGWGGEGWGGVFTSFHMRRKGTSSDMCTCETGTSLIKWKWKMWTRSFCARLPSKSDSWRCESEAFVRDFPQKMKLAIVTTKVYNNLWNAWFVRPAWHLKPISSPAPILRSSLEQPEPQERFRGRDDEGTSTEISRQRSRRAKTSYSTEE